MAFSTATITHQYMNADGTPSSGECVFTLLTSMTNAGVTIVPAHVTSTLSQTGELSQVLASNLDPATIPASVFWRVDERIQGAPGRTFEIQVPSGGVSVDLGGLMPGVTAPAFG